MNQLHYSEHKSGFTGEVHSSASSELNHGNALDADEDAGSEDNQIMRRVKSIISASSSRLITRCGANQPAPLSLAKHTGALLCY